MALTSPDNIWTPDSSDNYALTTDLAATADSIQDAITALRGNNAPTVRVANVAERNAALADHGTPTPDNPLIVFRADAGAGRELEYTTNGTTWHTLAAEQDTGWMPVNFTAPELTSASGYVRRSGDSVYMAGISIRYGTVPSNSTIGTIPTDFTQGFSGGSTPDYITIPLVANSNNAHGFLFIRPNGSVDLLHYSATGSTFLRGSGSWPALP